MIYKIKKFIAFTLAELLITLTIVGIVANLTIPAVIQSIQETQLRVAFKENYSIIDQATRRILTVNGSSLKGTWNQGNPGEFKNLYKPYLNYIKECEIIASAGVCWHQNDSSARYMDNTFMNDSVFFPGFVLSNGAMLMMISGPSDCSSGAPGFYFCTLVLLDVNGFKKPNIVGKDIYAIFIQDNGVKPGGVQNSSTYNTCNTSSSGLGCAAEYLRQ